MSIQESKQTLIVFDLQYKINLNKQINKQYKNKQAKNIFSLKSKFSQVSVVALPDWQLLHQVLENEVLHPIIY